MYYSHTYDTLEAFNVELDGIIYFIDEICKDSRMELKSNGRSNIEYIRKCLDTAKQLANATMKNCQN